MVREKWSSRLICLVDEKEEKDVLITPSAEAQNRQDWQQGEWRIIKMRFGSKFYLETNGQTTLGHLARSKQYHSTLSYEYHATKSPPVISGLDAPAMKELISTTQAFPTLMHIKNTKDADWIPNRLQKQFFQEALRLSEEEALLIGKMQIHPSGRSMGTSRSLVLLQGTPMSQLHTGNYCPSTLFSAHS